MKKLLLLLLAAGAVGLVISNRESPSAEEGAAPAPAPAAVPQQEPAPEQPAPAAVEPEPEAAPSPPPQLSAVTVAEPPAEPAAQAPPPARVPPAGVAEAQALLKAGDRLGARRVLTGLYLDARGEQAQALRAALDKINADLVFNPRCTEGATMHTVQQGELLLTIGKKHGVNWRMIGRLNAVDPKRLRLGRQLKILTGPVGIIVFKSEFRLVLLLDGAYVKEYRVGIGKEDRTPVGEFVVDSMEIGPPWSPPEGGVIRYGEEGYLLGERWIGFANVPGATGLGIHGTNDPSGMGTKCSNGCIRMRNEDVIEVFDFIQMGSRVEIME